MGKFVHGTLPALAFAGALLLAGAAAEAACVTKAGTGSGGSDLAYAWRFHRR